MKKVTKLGYVIVMLASERDWAGQKEDLYYSRNNYGNFGKLSSAKIYTLKKEVNFLLRHLPKSCTFKPVYKLVETSLFVK